MFNKSTGKLTMVLRMLEMLDQATVYKTRTKDDERKEAMTRKSHILARKAKYVGYGWQGRPGR